ncbi:MAG: hypothetical protein RLZZ546_3083, partial [Bacteroidota bacterium]
NIVVDLFNERCQSVHQIGEVINLDNAPFVFPVRIDTFNRVYVTIDDKVVLDENIYIGSEKVVKEIQ